MPVDRPAAPERADLRALAFGATTTGLLVTDPALPDHPVVEANPAFLAMTGYAGAEVLGRNCRFLQGPGTDPAAVARVRRAVAAGREATETLLNYRKDGTPFWNELRITPIRDGEGALTHFVGVQHDVTARVEAEAAARRAEGRFRALVEGVPGAVYARGAGPDLPPQYISPQAEGLLGYPPAAWESDPGFLGRVVHPDDLPAVLAETARAVAAGGTFLCEYRARTADGREVWLRDEARLVGPEAGEPYWQGVVLDVTAERAAAAERDRFFDLSLDPLAVAALDGTFRRVNPAFTRALDWSEAELLARPFLHLVHPDDLATTQAEVGRLAAGERALSFENRYRCRDGSWRWLSWNSVAEGGLIYAVARDVTAQKAAEAHLVAAREAAEEANRLKNQFFSTVSHELRTPLTAIIGYAELLLAGFSGDLAGSQAEDVGRILAGGERLLGLVNDVLDLTRIEAGRADVAFDPIDAAWVATQACADIAPQAAAKGIDLVVALPPGLPPVLADPRRVRQVLVNLLGNAVKFTDRGRVEVGARAPGDGTVDIWVRDTGVGIAPDDLPRVFDEFFQSDGSATRRHGGTGLGLAIARKVAELQGGAILAKSTPGHGSTFTLVLPAAPPGTALAASQSDAGPAAVP